MSLNILVDENMAGVHQYLAHLGSVHRVNGRALKNSDLKKADALLVRSVTNVDENLLKDTPVKFVGTATSGFDHIDRNYLSHKHIGFAHAPGSNANSVVEYVLGAIAEVGDKLEQLFSGGTVGIIAYGNIGSLLARRLSALGIRFCVYDPWLEPSQIENAATLEEVLACDVVTIHAQLCHTEPWPSFHLLGELELGQLRPGTLLINASRGAVVDNTALEKLLLGGAKFIAILDVWESEPLVPQSLLSLVRYGSAHIAGYSLDGKLLATAMLANAMRENFGAPPGSVAETGSDSRLPICLPGLLSGAPLLRALLKHNYDLAKDDQLLRQAVSGKEAANAAKNFDGLRKAYRVRREVYGSVVGATIGDLGDVKIIEAMGCKLSSEVAQGNAG